MGYFVKCALCDTEFPSSMTYGYDTFAVCSRCIEVLIKKEMIDSNCSYNEAFIKVTDWIDKVHSKGDK